MLSKISIKDTVTA